MHNDLSLLLATVFQPCFPYPPGKSRQDCAQPIFLPGKPLVPVAPEMLTVLKT